ncbi:hypothetical protein BQ8794_50605 [Mesorhizobium prunaredense]|uniref:MFS transporter n=1 Tax=Mesorhizobium prunaredense TaxID=1631249 RepID=A0A1R3VGV8_9HYPH|nr:hypothetical protein BQ8794_50605 [Mesorhizobium prunaredense]
MRAWLRYFLLFIGQFALFTYLRPFLESVTGLDIRMLSAALLTMGTIPQGIPEGVSHVEDRP